MKRLARSVLLFGTLAHVGWAGSAGLPTVPSAATESTVSSGLGGLLQAGLGLALVVALIFLFGWAMRRFGLQVTGSNRLLKVVSSVMVGPRERVVVLEVGTSWLVLGVASGQVNALHTMPAQSSTAPSLADTASSEHGEWVFSQSLRNSLAQLGKVRKTSE